MHGNFKVPHIENEPMHSYAPGTPQRAALQAAITELQQQLPFQVPCIVNGKPVETGNLAKQHLPHDHASHLATYHEATPEVIDAAITGALEAKKEWEFLPWADKAVIFLKAADLVAGKYRYKIMAATMLGQGKNAWQAEIDAAAELADFLRFGVKFVDQMYALQPEKNSPGCWNRAEYRPLEGFVLAVSPFNFTAIGGNLCAAPALLGNVVVWKPSPMATLANYITYQIFEEAGLPSGVIQFVPGPPAEVVGQAINHKDFAALHFTGSTHVFKGLWKSISNNLDLYRGYPRIVGETGGKNWHFVHESAETKNAVMQSVRAAFEYSGQKCSALSRLYVSEKQWTGGFKDLLLAQVGQIRVGPRLSGVRMWGLLSYDKILSYIQKAKDAGGEILIGGTGDDSKGYFVNPTVILTKDPQSVTMVEEIFGPVLTVYVYKDEEVEKTLDLIDGTSIYGLTGAIFASSRSQLHHFSRRLINAAGNVYYNEKCTGAVVGQQAFGGGRGSGTNDKAGSMSIYYRFTNVRSVKEGLVGLEGWAYPSNLTE